MISNEDTLPKKDTVKIAINNHNAAFSGQSAYDLSYKKWENMQTVDEHADTVEILPQKKRNSLLIP